MKLFDVSYGMLLLPLLLLAACATVAFGSAGAGATATSSAAPAPANATHTATANATHTATANATHTATANATHTATANATAAAVSKHEDSNVDASKEAVPEKQCFFPFWVNGAWMHTCMKYDEESHWCSLTNNFTIDKDWRFCHSHDLQRFKCHIPFKYKGQQHSKCLKIDSEAGEGKGAHHGFWCGLKSEVNEWSMNSKDWAYCETPDAVGPNWLKAAGPKAAPAASAVASGANQTAGTVGGAKLKVSGGTDGGSSGAPAIGSEATVGIAVGVVCAVLAVVAVVSAFAIRRRNRHKRGSALLPGHGADANTYGGVGPTP